VRTISVIKPSEEIKAFKCPVCGKILEIKNESKEYIIVNGNLTWGESVIFIGDSIGDYSQKNPCRICTHCLANILTGENPFADIIRSICSTPKLEPFLRIYNADKDSHE